MSTPGLDDSRQASTDVNALLRQDFSALEPVLYNAVVKRSGEARVAVGILSLTTRSTRVGETLPDVYHSNQTAVVYQSDALRFPRFDLHPANVAVDLVETAGRFMLGIGNLGKVEFDSHPEFSRQYRVKAFDIDATRWLFENRVLAQLASRPGLYVSGSNGSLIVYRAREEIPRNRLQAFVNEAVEVFRQFEAAARRPGTFNSATRKPVSDKELFVTQLASATGSAKFLPAVTLADAEAFLQLPPPRVIPPGIKRYWKDRVSPLAVVFGGLVAMAGVFLLNSDEGRLQWYVLIPLYLVFVGGAGILIWRLVASLRTRHLLQHGRTGTARIEAIQTFDSRIDGTTRTRLDLQFEVNGTLHRAICMVPAAAADRLKAIADGKRPIQVLYSVTNPGHALVADALVIEREVELW